MNEPFIYATDMRPEMLDFWFSLTFPFLYSFCNFSCPDSWFMTFNILSILWRRMIIWDFHYTITVNECWCNVILSTLIFLCQPISSQIKHHSKFFQCSACHFYFFSSALSNLCQGLFKFKSPIFIILLLSISLWYREIL